MQALAHLKQLPVIYVNLDRSTDRRAQFEENVAPLFATAVRQPALDGETVPDATVQQFVDGWRALWDAYKDELTSVNKPPGVDFRVRTQAANYAIARSHVAALRYGAATWDRFCVAEDDVMPKSALWTESVPLPDPENQLSIWSGGLSMAAFKSDDAAYSAGAQLTWKPLPTGKNAHNALCAGLIEVTAEAALMIADAVDTYSMSYDHAWGFALRCLRGQRLFPTAFGQVGESIRNDKVRAQVLSR